MKKIVEDSVFNNKTEENTKKVSKIINNFKEGLTKKNLVSKTRFLKKKERNEIIEDLLESGQIEYVSLKFDGKVTYVYRRIE